MLKNNDFPNVQIRIHLNYGWAEGATNIAHGKLPYNLNNFCTLYIFLYTKSKHLSGVVQQNNEKAMGQTFI